MTMQRARLALLAIFAGCLALQIVALIAVRTRMWPEELTDLLLKLFSLYSVHLGVILGGIFVPRRPKGRPVQTLAWTALLLALAWNVLLGWRVIAFSLAASDSAADVGSYLETVGPASAFFVSAVLGFFFTKGDETR